MKNEKNTMAKFGKLIHKYTIKDGVEDKAIVPLIYEGNHSKKFYKQLAMFMPDWQERKKILERNNCFAE